MRALRIIFINILILIGLFIFLEFGWRVALTIKNYNIPVVNYFGKTWYRVNIIELGQFDRKLIKTLKPNLKILNVDIPRYEKKSRISSDELGFRNNLNQVEFKDENLRILTVGDSFTFGDQVSDQSTWPSCIEKELKIKTDNGGYGGYSAGQSVRKAILESKKRKYSHVIWSIFFQDFERDFSKSLLIINDQGKLEFNDKIKRISKTKKDEILFFGYLKEYSFIFYHLDYKFFPKLKNIFKKSDNDNKNLVTKENFYGIDYLLIERNIKFLLKKFNEINIENKILLYQYGEHFQKSPYGKKIKDIIKKNSENYNFLIIDTAEEFIKYDKEKLRLLWFDHHTKLGNQVVCKYIIKKMNKDNSNK